MFQLNKKYLVFTLLLLFTEIIIALYAHDQIIRPYGGDFLVVILLYCFVKSIVNLEVIIAAIAVLLFSYLIEILQYFHIVEVLGLGNSKAARVIMGNSFEWADMLAYTLGIIFVVFIETKWKAQPAI
ncbi:DUF2809 domain-containing protein [Dyadobacter sp. NIV53]|uniref:ribosomal maturation YjgA family protein n=1 Tax=Dyadobacter sp. NIV53 TaxID=2861765 RepID=UPI001C875E64|nr:DUF2809 domain-containing protein [Dyadobacter sp. NIV53]